MAPVLLGNIDGYPDLGHARITGRAMVYNLNRVAFNPYSAMADHATAVGGIIAEVAPKAYTHVIPIWTSKDGAVVNSSNASRVFNSAYAYLAGRGVNAVNRECNLHRGGAGSEAIWGTRADLELVAKYPQMVHVQPAGNNGRAILNQQTGYPASAFDHLLIVGAVDSSNRIWPMSNTPQNRTFYKTGEVAPPEKALKNFYVCAPGVQVRVATSPGGYGTATGTSFASPHVMGLIALMYEKAPSLTPQACARIIKETCTKIGPPETYGWGLINVERALEVVAAL